MEADPRTLPVDSESWSEALYLGSMVDCRVDLHMVSAELVKLTPNTHCEGGQSTEGAHKKTANRSWAALRFRFPVGNSARLGSGRSYLAKVESD